MFKRWHSIAYPVVISSWIGLCLWAIYTVFINNAVIYGENGLLENIQVSILIVAGIIYGTTAFFKPKQEKSILLLCFMLCYAFILRELEIQDFDIPYILIFLMSGVGRNTTVLMGFVAIFIYALLDGYTPFKKASVDFLKARTGGLLVLGGVVLIVGSLFEKQIVFTHHVLFEELLEVSGYVLILLSSLASIDFISNTMTQTNELN